MVRSKKITKLHIMQLLQIPCDLILLRSKYRPQHPILKHPQLKFYCQCERTIFTGIYINTAIYGSVYFKLCIFLQKKKPGRQKIMAGSLAWNLEV